MTDTATWQHHAPLLRDRTEDGEQDIIRCACLAEPAADDHGRYWFSAHLAEAGAPDYMVEYWRFWSGIVEPTSTGIDRDKVARELFDYGVVQGEASKVYEELAGLSKPNTAAHHILEGAEAKYNEIHADLLLCDLLPEVEDVAARDAVIAYAEMLHPGAWEQYEQGQKIRESLRTKDQGCDSALLPLGSAPIEPCVKAVGHFDRDPTDLHQTQRGVRWADPDDDED